MGDDCKGIPPLLSTIPVYDTTFGTIDSGLTTGVQYSNDTLMERPPTLTEISINDPSQDTICDWVQYKNLFTTDNLGSVWTDPHGIVFHNGENSIVSNNDHFAYFRRYYPTDSLAHFTGILDTGIWTVQWRLNKSAISQRTFRLVLQHSGVPESTSEIQTISFPQPAKDHITITGFAAKEAYLFDIEGIEHPIHFENISEGLTISWQDLPKGSYYINIMDHDGKSHRAKIMVSP